MSKYDIIYADPPWHYKGVVMHTGAGKPTSGSSADHYPVMTLDQLKQLDIPSISADDSLIYMWSTGPILDQSIELMRAWLFKYITIGFVWDKQRVVAGNYTMSQCELCLIGKRGRIPRPRGARNVRQLISQVRTTHSTKPEEARKRIEDMFPTQRKVELFARTASTGWDVFGLEVADSIQIGSR